MFDGVYMTDDLRRVLELIGFVLIEGQTATLTFRASGYPTTAACCVSRSTVTAELSADWARGYARRQMTAKDVADLSAELARYRPRAWVHIDAGGLITVKQPT